MAKITAVKSFILQNPDEKIPKFQGTRKSPLGDQIIIGLYYKNILKIISEDRQ
jgi:hypothetical protein